jgi:Transcriptional regulator
MSERVKSAERVLRIFELLTENPQGLTLGDVTDQLGYPKSSAFALLTTMAARGFLDHDPTSRRYRAGIRLWQAGQAFQTVPALEQVAVPYLEQLRDRVNETAQLAVLDGVENVYIAKVDSRQPLRLESRVGARLPAYATGIGKALLSGLRDEEIRARFADVEMLPHTDQTITDVDALVDAVGEVRRRGWATDTSEYTPGVFCIAAPVSDRDGVVAAISVSLPEVRQSAAFVLEVSEAVQEQARALSRRLGATV